MKIAKVLIQHPIHKLDQTYDYRYDGFDLVKGMRVRVNFNNQLIVGVVVDLVELASPPTYRIKQISEQLDETSFILEEHLSLASFMKDYYCTTTIACLSAMLPPPLKVKEVAKPRYITYVVYQEYKELATPKQQNALAYLAQVKRLPKSEYVKQFKSLVKKVIESGAAYEEQVLKSAELIESEAYPKQTLTSDQAQAYQRIIQRGKYLLHGVTGSGKTEVFLQASEYYLQQGKQVLILVPEISLTSQMIKRVKGRFGKRVAIYHSNLNGQEKLEQYQLVLNNEVQIVVGTRSALFMPFKNLGLIVVDEEHDNSYQQQNNPRYHSVDVTNYRADYHQATLLLASATPSLKSYAMAYKGLYGLITLKQRINLQQPTIHVINMQQSYRQHEFGIVHTSLIQAIRTRLAKQEQVIILINRRGFENVTMCQSCNTVKTCPNCDIALNYHRSDQALHCHYCNYEEDYQSNCVKCGSSKFSSFGSGTQKVVEYLNEQIPELRILRMDYDTTRTKNAHEKILERFENHEADVLVGTQMIAKGLDFENVTLVGIVQADDALMKKGFNSGFETFTLINQAIGRSGRGKKAGEVYLQAFNPEHYAIIEAINNNYQGFFKQEMAFRHFANYPPYTYLGNISLIGYNVDYLMNAFNKVLQANRLKVKVLGPANLNKRLGKERVGLIVRAKEREELVRFSRYIQKELSELKNTQLEIVLEANDLA